MADLEVQEKDGKIYCPLKKAWHISTPEERVRQYYIAILANKYGYYLKQMEQELKVNNSKRGQGKARADIAVSYTHLDVYKRQYIRMIKWCPTYPVNHICWITPGPAASTRVTVSPAGIVDVYKRQSTPNSSSLFSMSRNRENFDK